MEDMRIALIGFGNVARALARMITQNRAAVYGSFGRRILVTAIATGSHGCLYNPKGIDLERALASYEGGGFTEDDADFTEDGADTLVYCGDYDVLAELSPLNIATGQPAANRIRHALGTKRHAISANKGPIAWYYSELRDLASSKGVKLLFESAVMDGTPIFSLKDECLKLCRVTEIEGVLNSTTNFVLGELAAGKSFAEALKEGRAKGFVEADPSMDIDGWDAAAKICVLANVLMDAGITPAEVRREGIRGITKEDIDAALSKGCAIKLMCGASRGSLGRVEAFASPRLVPLDSLYARVDGASSAISLTTDFMGKLTLFEHDPTIIQTAFGVFHDILRLM